MRSANRAAACVLLLLLVAAPLSSPLAAASTAGTPDATSRPLDVTGPDVDGVFTLRYEVALGAGAEVTLALDVVREDLDGRVGTSRQLGSVSFPGGTSTYTASFLPTEGPGDYTVALVVDDVPGDPLQFVVDEGGSASVAFLFEVDDEPTTLQLTSDSVNADGKLKSPGDALVTRALLEDANGWSDIDRVRYAVAPLAAEEGAAPLHEGDVAVDAQPQETRVPIEHRFASSPIAAGDYRLTLDAVRDNVSLAQASRTFSIRDVAPVLLHGSLENVTPDEDVVLSTALVIGDRNGVADGQLEARVYRGSVRAEDNVTASIAGRGPLVALEDGQELQDADGYGRRGFNLQVNVTARAPSGAYRVSLYVDGSLLATLPFDVAPLPHATGLEATHDNETFRLAFALDAAAHVELELGGTWTRAAFEPGRHNLSADAPGPDASYVWTLRVQAREDGPVLEEHSGWWNRTTGTMPLVASAERASSRLPAVWVLSAEGWDLAGASWNATFLDWDGAPVDTLTARFTGARIRVDGPPDLPPGRYQALVDVVLPNGTRGQTSWHFEAGPWMRLDLGEAVVVGREARVPVLNDGGLVVERFVVEVDGIPRGFALAWEEDGASQAVAIEGRRGVATGLDVRPGETGTLVVRLPEGPLPAGSLQARVRVLALPGGGAG